MDIFTALLLANSKIIKDNSFKFTITTDITNPSDKSFTIPLENEEPCPNDIEIDWGDGFKEIYIKPNDVQPYRNYAMAGTYQISIKAIGGDIMPSFRTSSALDNIKIISMDTPLLKMQASSSDGIGLLSGCINLNFICEKFLINNDHLTNLSDAFLVFSDDGTDNLINVPMDLLSYCPDLTNIGRIFYNRTKLKNLPYIRNRKITDFSQMARNCYSLKLQGDIFFTEAEKLTRFSDVTSQVSFFWAFILGDAFIGEQGTAPALWECTYPNGVDSSAFVNHSTTSLTNYNSIPSGWK